jgi:hypothetical protein
MWHLGDVACLHVERNQLVGCFYLDIIDYPLWLAMIRSSGLYIGGVDDSSRYERGWYVFTAFSVSEKRGPSLFFQYFKNTTV